MVLLLSLVLLLGSAGATLARGFAFMPNIDMNTVNLTVSMPEGCTREQAVSLADEVLRRAAQVENVETVGAMMSSSGSSGCQHNAHSDSGQNTTQQTCCQRI